MDHNYFEIPFDPEFPDDIVGEYVTVASNENDNILTRNQLLNLGIILDGEQNEQLIANSENNDVVIESQPLNPVEDEYEQPNTLENMPETNENIKLRHRKPCPSEWKQNKRSADVTSRKRHLSKAGKTIPEKVLKLDDCDCSFLCRHAITYQQQTTLFEEYYGMTKRSEQRSFLSSLIIVNSVARRTTGNPVIARNCSVIYMLRNDTDHMMRVCQKFFCNTFAISAKIVRNIANRISPTTGKYNPDHGNVGRVPKSRVTPERKMDRLKTFIHAFPKLPSHYSRKKSTYLYLEPGLNVTKLYSLYCEKVGTEEAVSINVFRRVFNDWEPRIVFHTPLKDQCKLCNNLDDSMEYMKHLERKTDIREIKAADKENAENNASMIYATFDLQAVLVLPYCQDSLVYYKRKMSVYNFTIFDSRQKVLCNVYDECNGKKSSTEVGSCLYDYLESLDAKVQHVVFYSDTCSGQNRNQYVLSTLLYAVDHIKNMDTIDLKFMESGHSFMECDSVHSRIEKNRKNRRIFSPTEYENIMKTARVNPRPYEVKRWYFNDFYDIRSLAKNLLVNRNKDENDDTVDWLRVKWFRCIRGSKMVFFKYDVKEEFRKLDVSKASGHRFIGRGRGRRSKNVHEDVQEHVQEPSNSFLFYKKSRIEALFQFRSLRSVISWT